MTKVSFYYYCYHHYHHCRARGRQMCNNNESIRRAVVLCVGSVEEGRSRQDTRVAMYFVLSIYIIYVVEYSSCVYSFPFSPCRINNPFNGLNCTVIVVFVIFIISSNVQILISRLSNRTTFSNRFNK